MVIIKIDPKACRRTVCIVPEDFTPDPSSDAIIIKHAPPTSAAVEPKF